jgi:hypothetical protein
MSAIAPPVGGFFNASEMASNLQLSRGWATRKFAYALVRKRVFERMDMATSSLCAIRVSVLR